MRTRGNSGGGGGVQIDGDFHRISTWNTWEDLSTKDFSSGYYLVLVSAGSEASVLTRFNDFGVAIYIENGQIIAYSMKRSDFQYRISNGKLQGYQTLSSGGANQASIIFTLEESLSIANT